MAWAVPSNSKTNVDKAGVTLVTIPAVWTYEAALEMDRAYEIIGNWRSSHNFPLNTFQTGLRSRSRKIDADSIVAQRIKRLSSIALKLKRFPSMRLSMMQDIGGCRAVLGTVEQVRMLVSSYKRSEIKHKMAQEDDYIDSPKRSGYRGVHLIFKYFSDKKETYNGLKIEIQLRSTLQHAWATAVETVGTFIQQALKSSQGEEDWLRFFALMGTAIALREGCNPVPNTPTDVVALIDELKFYIHKLDAENHLRTYGVALNEIELAEPGAHYYLLELDASAKQIKVTGYKWADLSSASNDYLEVEKGIKDGSKQGTDAVLVSVDSISALKRAYPNYFLDTHVFIDAMKEAVSGQLRLTPL